MICNKGREDFLNLKVTESKFEKENFMEHFKIEKRV